MGACGWRLAGEGSRRQELGLAFRLLPLHRRHVGEKAEDGVTDLMCLEEEKHREESSWFTCEWVMVEKQQHKLDLR